MPAGVQPSGLAIDPSGNFLYVTNSGSNDVSQFRINGNTGQLDQLGANAPAGINPASVTISPSDQFAYVADSGSNDVAIFNLDRRTGLLTPAGNAPAGTAPDWVKLDPKGKFLYVGNADSGDMYAYDVNGNNGGVTYDHGSNTGNLKNLGIELWARFIPFVPRFAYVPNSNDTEVGGGNIAEFTVDLTDPSLLLREFGSVSDLTNPVSAVTAGFPAPSFVYAVAVPATDAQIGLSGFQIGLDGEMAWLGFGVTYPYAMSDLTVDPSNRFVYVARVVDVPSWSASIDIYFLDSGSGLLTFVGNSGVEGNGPERLAVDPTGRFLYVANFISKDIAQFAIDSKTGTLTSLGSMPVGEQIDSLTIAPSGKFLFVASPGGGEVRPYYIDGTNGLLVSLGGYPTKNTPWDVAVSPNGRWLYVAIQSGIELFSINLLTGELTEVGETPPSGRNLDFLTIDSASGRFLVATDPGGALLAYLIDSKTGVPSLVQTVGSGGNVPRRVVIASYLK